MPKIVIRELVDIYQCPLPDPIYPGSEGVEITIGDLHANTMKLIFMLIKQGILTGIDSAKYQQLVGIYLIPANLLTKKNLDIFNQILDQAAFNNSVGVRLIGDELADRGNNDYFTLKVIEKLHEHQVPIEILLSNHGIEFIMPYEQDKPFYSDTLKKFAASMFQMQCLIYKDLVTRDEILAIVNKAYKPYLSIISYSLNPEKTEITIYSHARINRDVIQNMALAFSLKYKADTAVDLAMTIEAINREFQLYVNRNGVSELLKLSDLTNARMDGLNVKDPFLYAIWNRAQDTEASIASFKIDYVHGHDSTDRFDPSITNLDNILGKQLFLNQGEYSVLYSHEPQVPNPAIAVDIKNEALVLSAIFRPILSPISHQKLPRLFVYLFKNLKKIEIKTQDLEYLGDIEAYTLQHALKALSQNYLNNIISRADYKTLFINVIALSRVELKQYPHWLPVLNKLEDVIAKLKINDVNTSSKRAKKIEPSFFKSEAAHKPDALKGSSNQACLRHPLSPSAMPTQIVPNIAD